MIYIYIYKIRFSHPKGSTITLKNSNNQQTININDQNQIFKLVPNISLQQKFINGHH